jgi:type I restriction enzyme S subunit
VRFLTYRLQHSDVAGYLTGSTQPKLTQQALLSMKFPWPTIEEQRTIASLLGAIDDKIDANQRTCSIAEALATRLLESAINRTHVSEIADIQRLIIDPASSGPIKVDHFSLPAFDEGRLPIRQPGEEIKSGKLHIRGVSVLVSRLNPHIPRVWYAVPENGVLGVASTEFVVMTPTQEVSAEELWACCNSPDFTSSLVESVTGTTGSHQRVHQTDVVSIEIGDPRSLDRAVRQSVTALVKAAVLLRKESVVLASLRDTILPRLLSGEFHILQSDPLVELPA